MNKLIVLIGALITVNSMASFAISASDTQGAPTITCPKIIKCSNDYVSSCKAIGDNLEHWGKIYANAPVTKGIYYFQLAQVMHQSPSKVQDIPICKYPLMISNGYLSLHAKESSSLEASSPISTNWRVDQHHKATCYIPNIDPLGKDPELCPFNKIPLIGITLSSSDYISLSAHTMGHLMEKAPVFYSPGFPNGVITMYQTVGYCPGYGQCSIDLMITMQPDKHIRLDIGNVVVDMDNKMEILQVNSYPSTGYEVTKSNYANAIEIRQVKVNG